MDIRAISFVISLCVACSGALGYAIGNAHLISLSEAIQFDKLASERRFSDLNRKLNEIAALVRKEVNLIENRTALLEQQLLSIHKASMIDSKEHNDKPQNCDAVSAAYQEQQIAQCQCFDAENALSASESENYGAKRRALTALSLVGSPEDKEKVVLAISDDEEDISLRRELIKTMDWRNHGYELTDLFSDTEQSTLRTDIISAAEESTLTQQERAEFETTILENLARESDSAVKIATLDYFANTDQERYREIIGTLDSSNLSQELQQHIQSIESFEGGD